MRAWAHVTSSFRGHWLPGDPRGFRDHGHRVHSSGDYQHPPPPGEHEGLLRYARSITGAPIVLNVAQRRAIGAALLHKFARMTIEIGALAVGPQHAHALLLAGDSDAVEIMGRAKQFASHRMRAEIPGKMWGASSHVVRVRDGDHFESVRAYILDHVREGAWVWGRESGDGAVPAPEASLRSASASIPAAPPS